MRIGCTLKLLLAKCMCSLINKKILDKTYVNFIYQYYILIYTTICWYHLYCRVDFFNKHGVHVHLFGKIYFLIIDMHKPILISMRKNLNCRMHVKTIPWRMVIVNKRKIAPVDFIWKKVKLRIEMKCYLNS